MLTLLTIAFFTAIAYLAYRLYRQFRHGAGHARGPPAAVLYGSIGVAFLTFCATQRMFDAGGLGVLAWFALLGLCSYGLFWVWQQYRELA